MSIEMQKYIMNRRRHEEACIKEENRRRREEACIKEENLDHIKSSRW
jgi:hypothetical protein